MYNSTILMDLKRQDLMKLWFGLHSQQHVRVAGHLNFNFGLLMKIYCSSGQYNHKHLKTVIVT
jgi:hypothetical protein